MIYDRRKTLWLAFYAMEENLPLDVNYSDVLRSVYYHFQDCDTTEENLELPDTVYIGGGRYINMKGEI